MTADFKALMKKDSPFSKNLRDALGGTSKAIQGISAATTAKVAPPSVIPQQAVSARGLFSPPAQRAPNQQGLASVLAQLSQQRGLA